jgi:2-polyprenyl-3-methyl-5-hydroxy-6-metoxy-1,4-benzoquinol methylase
MRLALAYRSSMVLFAASELDVFSQLASGPKSSDDVARACGSHAEATRLLLDACVADGLLDRDGSTYSNSAVAAAFLVKGQPAYIGNGMKYAEDLYPAWGQLAEHVRSGKPVMVPEEILGNDPEKTRAFIYAMHERARGIGSVLPSGINLAGRRHLLDVGGGPGTYSISLVKSAPGLRSTILDLPAVLEISKEIVAANGCSDRIDTRPGNYLTADFGSGYDAVLLSGMMHREQPEACQLLLRKAFAALDAGGIVIVSDVFFDDEARTEPPFATFFALSMALTAVHGTTHSKLHMARWMTDAGFSEIEIRDLPKPNPHRLVIGHRSWKNTE